MFFAKEIPQGEIYIKIWSPICPLPRLHVLNSCLHCTHTFDQSSRSLGVEHSFVLSCKLDNWTNEQVNHMEECGNEKINAELEYSVPKTIEVPCLSYTDRDTREKYIQAKYVAQLFKKAIGKTARPPERVVRKTSPQGSPTSGRSPASTAMIEYIGIVHVHVIECRDLIVKDILSSDPYCVLHIGTQVNKTKTKYKTLSPKYNEHFTFSWDGCDPLILSLIHI